MLAVKREIYFIGGIHRCELGRSIESTKVGEGRGGDRGEVSELVSEEIGVSRIAIVDVRVPRLGVVDEEQRLLSLGGHRRYLHSDPAPRGI
jgi:hypothetical protein